MSIPVSSRRACTCTGDSGRSAVVPGSDVNATANGSAWSRPAAAARHQVSSHELTHVESAEERAPDNLLEEGRIVVEEVPPAREGRVAHENVQAAERPHRAFHHRLAGGTLEDIALDQRGLPAQ